MPQTPYHAPFVQKGVPAVRVPECQPVDPRCVAVQCPLPVLARRHPPRQNVGVDLAVGAARHLNERSNFNIHIAVPRVGNNEINQPLLGPRRHIQAILKIVRQRFDNVSRYLNTSPLPLAHPVHLLAQRPHE